MSQVNRSDIKKSPSGPRESRQAGMVLLVDDDAIALELTSTMLSMLGFTVLRAMDGLEAVGFFAGTGMKFGWCSAMWSCQA